MATVMTYSQSVRRQDLYHDGSSSVGDSESLLDGERDAAAAAARAALERLIANSFDIFGDTKTQAPTGAHVGVQTEKQKKKKAKAKESRKEKGEQDGQEEQKQDATATDNNGAVEFSFRLFSSAGSAHPTADPSNATTAPLHKVLLDPGDIFVDAAAAVGVGISDRDGGLVNGPRPLSFYVAAAPTPEQLARYAETCVDGASVQAQAVAECRNAWGWEVPWRSRTVRVSPRALQALLANAKDDAEPDGAKDTKDPKNTKNKKNKSANIDRAALAVEVCGAPNRLPSWTDSTAASPAPMPSRKCRPGKKRRILRRQRDQARAEKQAQRQTKEEHLQDKKKRMNRLKKLRRREKKRESKPGSDDKGKSDSDASDT